jgi:Flp pilus assembly protein protease CpaA
MSGVEIYGYLSMLVVVASCLMKDVLKLRIGNLIGCVMFVAYGIMKDAMPVVVMNVIIIAIHGYYIAKIWKSK